MLRARTLSVPDANALLRAVVGLVSASGTHGEPLVATPGVGCFPLLVLPSALHHKFGLGLVLIQAGFVRFDLSGWVRHNVG